MVCDGWCHRQLKQIWAAAKRGGWDTFIITSLFLFIIAYRKWASKYAFSNGYGCGDGDGDILGSDITPTHPYSYDNYNLMVLTEMRWALLLMGKRDSPFQWKEFPAREYADRQ